MRAHAKVACTHTHTHAPLHTKSFKPTHTLTHARMRRHARTSIHTCTGVGPSAHTYSPSPHGQHPQIRTHTQIHTRARAPRHAGTNTHAHTRARTQAHTHMLTLTHTRVVHAQAATHTRSHVRTHPRKDAPTLRHRVIHTYRRRCDRGSVSDCACLSVLFCVRHCQEPVQHGVRDWIGV
jgi:hypothetical protein